MDSALLRTSVSALIALGFAHTASAALLSEEHFSYSAGALTGQNGGTGWAGVWTISGTGANVSLPGFTYTDPNFVQMPVSGGKGDLPGGNAGDFRLTLNSPDTTGTLYVSFLAQLSANPAAGYAGLSLFGGTTAEALFLGKATNQLNWGIDSKTGNVVASAIAASTLSLLVYRIDFGATTTVSLYVNPTLGTEPGVSSISTTRTNFTWDTIRIQSGNGAIGSFDEIRTGTDYASVAPVPEPASIGALAAGLGVLGLVRRRKR